MEVAVSTLVNLLLRTADDRPLMHKFYRQEEEAHALLVTFPGKNYGVDGPMLYYPSELLMAAGWDTLAVSYGFQTGMQELSVEVMPGLFEECRTVIEAALGQRDYSQIGFIGKSIGAGVVAHLFQVESGLGTARGVYLTPPLGTPFFDPVFTRTKQPAYLAIGTADRFYQPESLDSLRKARSFKLALIEGADHSMDVTGDLQASIEAVKRVTREVVDFLTQS
jgi:dienelactone hydrolase